MATDDERREVAENLRYLADYPGAAVRYAEQLRDELCAVVLPDGYTHGYSELLQRLADLIEPKGIESEALKPVESDGVDREAMLALAKEMEGYAPHESGRARKTVALVRSEMEGYARRIRAALG